MVLFPSGNGKFMNIFILQHLNKLGGFFPSVAEVTNQHFMDRCSVLDQTFRPQSDSGHSLFPFEPSLINKELVLPK